MNGKRTIKMKMYSKIKPSSGVGVGQVITSAITRITSKDDLVVNTTL